MVNACLDLSRAIDACGPDAHAARERIYLAAEQAIQPLLQEWLESIVCNAGDNHG
jgi:hypothetical protein